jgi:hypothetical protein
VYDEEGAQNSSVATASSSRQRSDSGSSATPPMLFLYSTLGARPAGGTMTVTVGPIRPMRPREAHHACAWCGCVAASVPALLDHVVEAHLDEAVDRCDDDLVTQRAA